MAKFSALGFFRSQFTRLPPVYHVNLTGKTVVVTGSNVGLGLETAKYFARMNPANLILAVRSKSKGNAALAGSFIFPLFTGSCVNLSRIEIQQETGYTGGKVMILDLGNFASISAFAAAFQEEHDRLDVLVCNAGVETFDYETSKDGWETTYASIFFPSHTILKFGGQDSSQSFGYNTCFPLTTPFPRANSTEIRNKAASHSCH
jgi:retinol dehydrogenase 12